MTLVAKPITNIREISGKITSEQLDKISNVFVATKRGQSGWMKDGSNPSDPNAPTIDTTKTTTVPIKSRVWDGKYGFRETMYIPGASTIFVRSIRDSKNEIIERGLDADYPDMEKERKASMKLGIQFKSGILNIADYGSDLTLKMYLATHENNIDRPYFEELRSQSRAIPFFNFRPYEKEKKEIEIIDKVEAKTEAINMVLTLRTKEGKKISYNKTKIDAYINMLNLGALIEADDYSGKLNLLLGSVTSRPENFTKIIKDTLDEVTMTIAKATTLSVISFDKGKVRFTDSKDSFFEVPKGSTDSDTENLSLFLASKEGADYYIKISEKNVAATIAATKQ